MSNKKLLDAEINVISVIPFLDFKSTGHDISGCSCVSVIVLCLFCCSRCEVVPAPTNLCLVVAGVYVCHH